MALFCGHCGSSREKKDKFCMKCGASFAVGTKEKADKAGSKAEEFVVEVGEAPPKSRIKQYLLLAGAGALVITAIGGIFIFAKQLGQDNKEIISQVPPEEDSMQSCVGEANRLRDSGNLDQAIVKMESCRDEFADQAYVWWYLGETYETSREFCKAVEAYDKAAELYDLGTDWGSRSRAKADEVRPQCTEPS